MVMVIECFWETYFDLNTFEEDVSHVLEFFWEWSFDIDTFEADWSHSSDAGQSFDIECKFEEVFFEFLPNDKLHLLAFNLWVEDEVLKLLEIFECDLPSTDKVYLFGFKFSTLTSSIIIILEIFWGIAFDSNTFEEDLSHSIDTEHSIDFDCWVEAYFLELLPSDKVHSFDFDFWVEEEFSKLLETFECDLSSTSDKVHSIDLDLWLSHSTDEVNSFDFEFGVEEEF